MRSRKLTEAFKSMTSDALLVKPKVESRSIIIIINS